MKKTLLGLLVASSFGVISLPAQSEVDIVVGVAPPPLRYERVPAYERRGYMWEQGYWRWNGRRHVWVAGNWQRHRPGYTYYAPRWEERDGRWAFSGRRWDRDGDGVPDRYDRRPDNPNRS
jgi:hypothetical protein